MILACERRFLGAKLILLRKIIFFWKETEEFLKDKKQEEVNGLPIHIVRRDHIECICNLSSKYWPIYRF